MARGSSGRIVIEIDPEIKDQLYRALYSDGATLKKWFLSNTERFLEERNQPSLFESSPRRIREP